MAGMTDADMGRGGRRTGLLALWALAGFAILLVALVTIGRAQAQQNPASAIFVSMSNPCVPGGYELYTCGYGNVVFESGELELAWFRFSGVAEWEYNIRGIAGPTTELYAYGSDASTLLASNAGTWDTTIEFSAPADGDIFLKLNSPLPPGFYVESTVEIGGYGPLESPTPTNTPTPTGTTHRSRITFIDESLSSTTTVTRLLRCHG